MIRHTNVTSRDAAANEQEVLTSLQQLDPGWTYVGRVGDIKLFKLTIIVD